MNDLYADIVLRLAVPKTLQFAVPDRFRGQIRPGQRVRVPLRRRHDIGYVAGLSSEAKVRGIRPITEILDRDPLLAADLLDVLLWTAEHYLAPPGLVFRSALPRAVHLAETPDATARKKAVSYYRLSDERVLQGPEREALARKAPRQAEILALLCDGPLPSSKLPGGAPLKALVDKGLLSVERRFVSRGVVPPPPSSRSPHAHSGPGTGV